MKVLMINHFPLAGSGSGTYTKNLAVHLAALGHEVCVILPENTTEYERVPGIRLRPVFFTRMTVQRLKARRLKMRFRLISRALPRTRAASQHLRTSPKRR